MSNLGIHLNILHTMKSMWSACITRHKPSMLRMVHGRLNYSVMPMTCSQLKEQLDQQIEHDAFCKSVTVIEVRNRQEIEDSGKIKYSMNIPLPHLIEDPHRLLADFPKDRKVKKKTGNWKQCGIDLPC
jgi:hypothetical protein